MSLEPKVTGLSPMTGPPGSKITVRGENFGQSCDDIIQLTINGADCLPYLEWKSSKKIITRCTKAFGNGDVIITTNSGGTGTCDVQFNCYEETIGLTDESAVWVDEIDRQALEKDKLTVTDRGEEYSLEISSSKFKPELYILHNCSEASLQDLEQLQTKLRRDLAAKSDPEVVSSSSNRAALLKSNLPVIMECLQILEHLSKVVNTSKDPNIATAIKSIKDSLDRTHDFFDPLLAQKDLVHNIESAMQVFRQNETLFSLPNAIETSIKTKDYDSVVKEISAVQSRLKTIDIDQTLITRIQTDVTNKVNKLKRTIEEQLLQSCRSTEEGRNIDEVRKLISHLSRLGEPVTFDVWTVMKEMSGSLQKSMSEKYDYFLKLSQEEVGSNAPSEVERSSSQNSEPPPAVKFVQSAIGIFHNTYYDLLSLGQSYFDYKDELCCKDSEEIRLDKLEQYEENMVAKSIAHLSCLLRKALVPDSGKLENPSDWPRNCSDAFVNWIGQTLNSVITCHINLTKVSLPPAVRVTIEDFKELLFEIRVRFMRILFENSTKLNKNLHHHEDWMVEVDDTYGGTTRLPLIFENNVIDTLRFANETIFKAGYADEKSILKRVDVQASMKELAHGLINSFIDSLENALIDSKESPAASTRILVASKDSKHVPSEYMSRLLITISNCQFTRDQVFARLQSEFERLQGLKMDRVFKVCSKKYGDYILKTSDKYCRLKCAELSKMINNNSVNGNDDDLQINLMVANSQIFLVAPQLVNSLMTSIVNQMQKEKT